MFYYCINIWIIISHACALSNFVTSCLAACRVPPKHAAMCFTISTTIANHIRWTRAVVGNGSRALLKETRGINIQLVSRGCRWSWFHNFARLFDPTRCLFLLLIVCFALKLIVVWMMEIMGINLSRPPRCMWVFYVFCYYALFYFLLRRNPNTCGFYSR